MNTDFTWPLVSQELVLLVPVVRELLPVLVPDPVLVLVPALPLLSSEVLPVFSQGQRDILSEKVSEQQRKESKT